MSEAQKSRDQGQGVTSVSIDLPAEGDAWIWQATWSSSVCQ